MTLEELRLIEKILRHLHGGEAIGQALSVIRREISLKTMDPRKKEE